MIKTENMFEFLDISKKLYKKVSDNTGTRRYHEHVKYTNLKTTYFLIDMNLL